MPKSRVLFPCWLCCALAAQSPPTPSAASADAVDAEAVAFFREEGTTRSQVMEHLSWLCDVYGPRMTGSTNLDRAERWAVAAFERFGFAARREEWGPFGRGWEFDRVEVRAVGDNPWPVLAYPKAWSPAVEGEAEVVHVAAMTADELAAADLAGKIVLVDDVREVAEPFEAPAQRHDATSLLRLADQQRVEALPAGERAAAARAATVDQRGFRRRGQMLRMVFDKAPLCIVDRAAKGDYGTVFVSRAEAVNDPDAPRGERVSPQQPGAVVIPQFTFAVEHYNRICRLLQKGVPVRLSVTLSARYLDGDGMQYNVLADRRGGERPEELAMLGAHIDSWHSGTGCTDNGCGSAVVLEAARLIGAWCEHRGAPPRRTIRACLWSGEEQGLLGSMAYARQHFGGDDAPTAERAQVAGYFNLDNGTGRVRGVYLQGNEACAPIFRQWLRPFHGDDASTLTLDDTGGTDHLSFVGAGVPGFQFIQDAVAYGTRTHHSNMDNWDHAVAADLQQAAILMATFVWQTAQRDEPLPRPRVQ